MAKKLTGVCVPGELLDSKEYKALVAQMGEENTREFFQKESTDLRAIIAECEVQSKEAQNLTEENVEYQRSKGVMDDFKKALRDALKPLKLKQKAAAKIITNRKSVAALGANATPNATEPT